MRLILSRKGFDTSNGGVPSPIFPDGRLLSLPIPSTKGPIAFRDIGESGKLGRIVEDLTGGKVKASDRVHLDPDLDPTSLLRLPGWIPGFGQIGSSQGHLANCGVGIGDLFLFFGLFQNVEQIAENSGHYRLVGKKRHVLFGWLQIGEIIPVPKDMNQLIKLRPWLRDHPHVHTLSDRRNTIYIASEHLSLDSFESKKLPGAGTFPRLKEKIILSKLGQDLPSLWSLPSWFYPISGRIPLSYHGALDRWRLSGNIAELRSIGRGQEFVLDCDQYPEAITWAADLISEHGAQQ